MRDSLPYFAPFLEDEVIYRDFMAVISHLISSTSSNEVKLDKDGNPIMFTFADCDEPIEYDNA
ncbi:hypothetical protein TELCIR_20049 [Teladorsagia circumcincta]|uniref:Uncharacterized protein n=1 Tax=Teladorsagia circumcincta TaxID=45464 RepID=A0A2G9TKK7_TELCI|nr:hypothetical protein TELCIR_20049 [Teladorsagia circumcincta]